MIENLQSSIEAGESLHSWRREAQHREVDLGRYCCRCFRWGEGPALVFIPGLCSDGPTYVPLMARLRSDFTCVGYDLPGLWGARYSHDDLVDDLCRLVDGLHIQQASLIGFSFGSTIALSALSARPRRFQRAVLQGGFARRPLAPAEVFACYWARYLPGTIAHMPPLRRLARHLHSGPFQQRPEADWRYFLDCQGRTPLRAFAQRALLMHALDLRPRLPSIAQQVLLVCGDRDPLVARCYQEELRADLACAAVAEIEGAGHHPHLSHPDIMAELLRLFLQAPSCGG